MQLEDNTAPILFDNEFVKFVAEDSHIGTVSDAVSESILNHIHYAMRMILLYAKENQIACARTELGLDDIRIALKDLGINEPIGFGFETGYVRRAKHDSKIQLDPLPNAQDVTKLQVEPVDEFFDADVCMTAHWLVIDGVQPAIPENPLKDYNNMENGDMDPDKPTLANTLLLKDLGKKMPKTEHVQIKTVATHSVSLEQQIYFKEIMETVMCAEEQKRAAALLALKTDPGLQVLAPRFSNLFAEGVRCNLIQENVAFLIYLMRIMDSLVMNSTINLEKCLHEIVPAITSCLVIKSIGPEGAKDASWTLRDFCGKLLMKILTRYKIPQVRIRILRVFSQIFQQRDPSVPSLYAVVHAIHLFGVEAVENILFPNLSVIKTTLSKSRTAPNRTKTGDDPEAYGKQRLTDLVMRLMKNYANSDRMPEKSLEHCRIVFGPYGDDIYYMISPDNDRRQSQYY